LGISIERWAQALQDFVRLRRLESTRPLTAPYVTSPAARDALTRESAPTGVLRRFAFHIGHQKRAKAFRRRDVQLSMLDLAQAHYRRLWTSCSSEEKVLLYHIAREGLVSRRATPVLFPLFRRGLVQPPCRLMNESFRQFVIGAEPVEVFAKWQERGEVSWWARMRMPLVVALSALAAFFFATQREALNQSLGFLAAIAAVGPALITVTSSLGKLRSSGDSKPSSSSRADTTSSGAGKADHEASED
jgi:hypothetical protein